MKIGLLFAGQGAQYAGMGKDLYDSFDVARDVFDRAGDEIKKWCFNGSEEELMQTHITQPCVYTMTMAALSVFCDKAGVVLPGCLPKRYVASETSKKIVKSNRFEDVQKIAVVEGMEAVAQIGKAERTGEIEASATAAVRGLAGFSLGEYAALTAAGTITDIETGIDLIRRRGQYMAEAGRYPDGRQRGGMCAVLGERDKVLALIREVKQSDVLEAVNFNTHTQTVVAGDMCALERLKERGREARLKVIPLNVSTAFHSRMMEPAAGRLKEALEGVDIQPPSIKVYSNITGRDIMEGMSAHDGRTASEISPPALTMSMDMAKTTPVEPTGDAPDTVSHSMAADGCEPSCVSASEWLKSRLSLQVMHPVFWQETVENMVSDGIDLFIEFGPGKTLCGFVKKIASGINVCNVENVETLEAALEVFRKHVLDGANID